MATTRRQFLFHTGAALAAGAVAIDFPSTAYANPLGKPIGLQLYTVEKQLKEDFEGTLHRVAAVGYKEVESAGFFGRKPAEFKSALSAAGLHCGSVHIVDSAPPQESMDYAAALGAKYIISSEPSPLPGGPSNPPKKPNAYTLDDFKSIAEHANQLGEQAKKTGLQFGCHNHNFEFRPIDGKIGYDELLRSTDPDLVKFELDCGWMSAAGHNPAAYLKKFPHRYRLLHIKDFKPTAAPSVSLDSKPEAAELGRGHVDYKPIFAAAKHSDVEWFYVEQEPPFVHTPALEAIRINYEYLHAMS